MATLREAIEDSYEEHQFLIDNGLLDPDQPTHHATLLKRARRLNLGRPFNAEERRMIRESLRAEPPIDGDRRRVGVTGGRDFDDPEMLNAALSRWCRDGDLLVHGNAVGADRNAALWFHERGWPTEPHNADWGRHGKAAGPIRNDEMLKSGLDILIAFPGGRGTADMVSRCQKAGVTVVFATEPPSAPAPTNCKHGKWGKAWVPPDDNPGAPYSRRIEVFKPYKTPFCPDCGARLGTPEGQKEGT